LGQSVDRFLVACNHPLWAISMPKPITSNRRGEVLVALINNITDFEIARDGHWYRISVSSTARFRKQRWSPQRLAFYQA